MPEMLTYDFGEKKVWPDPTPAGVWEAMLAYHELQRRLEGLVHLRRRHMAMGTAGESGGRSNGER